MIDRAPAARLPKMGRSGGVSYYELLGVDPRITPGELRRAWRRIALQWHPDRAGPTATSKFQKLASAYAVLSDPAARAAYDRRLGIPRRAERAQRADDPVTPRAPAVMLSRLTGSLDSLVARGMARQLAAGLIDLYIDEAEAAQGGMAMVSMYVDVRCPSCKEDAAAPSCGRCGGRHQVRELFSAWLALPPGAADGVILTPSVMLKGMLFPVHFRLRTPPRHP
jgi:molecular chaperone DnaJ